jgi:hypothetical protein
MIRESLKSGMPEEIDILKLVCRKLEHTGIPYMLTGSLAANFYAVPRMTRDIDFVIQIFTSEADKFFRSFESEFYISKPAIKEAIGTQGMFNAIHNSSVFKIDFIVRKDSSYRSTEFQRRKRIELDGQQIWIVAPEDLIISKLFWAKDSFSELQIKDVRNLLLSIKNLDQTYIDKWVKMLGLNNVYEKVAANG